MKRQRPVDRSLSITPRPDASIVCVAGVVELKPTGSQPNGLQVSTPATAPSGPVRPRPQLELGTVPSSGRLKPAGRPKHWSTVGLRTTRLELEQVGARQRYALLQIG